MQILNEQQLLFIENRLAQANLKLPHLKEELLDHLCCGIEEELAAGYTFHQAVDRTFSLFSDQEFNAIEKQTLFLTRQKPQLMKAFSLFVFSLILAIPTFFFFQEIEPPTISPLAAPYKISSEFGFRHHKLHQEKVMHQGIDFPSAIGTPVLATSDGIVEKTEQKETGYGHLIVLRHDEIYTSFYAHLDQINVEKGQVVKRGEVIGTVGHSGAATFPHLHYEVRQNDAPQNPKQFIRP